MVNESKIVSKKLLYDVIYDQFSITRKESTQLVNLVLNEILETLVRGENVKLAKFGTFSINKQAARQGRNIKTDGEGYTSALGLVYEMLRFEQISQTSEDLSKYHAIGIQESIKESGVVS